MLAGVLAPAGNGGDALLAVLLVALLAARALWEVGPGAVVAMALVCGVHFAGPSFAAWATKGEVQAWNLFHYTIGARFFGELGYHDLYVGALAADRAGEDELSHVRLVRDLHTYERGARPLEAAWRVDEHLSPARADELRGAIHALEPMLAHDDWRNVFLDRGYNATPPFTALAAVTAEALPVEDPVRRRVATTIDLVLLAVGLAAVLAAWGLEATALVALLLAVFPGTEGRLVGGFLQYDWLAALLVGAGAMRTGRPVAAAFALSWAAASRLFPAALIASALMPALWGVIRRREASPFDRRLALATAGFAALWLLLGCFTARGPAAWLEFVPRFLLHAREHVVGERRIGLQHLLTWAPGASDEGIRAALLADRAPLWWALAALGLAGWAWAAARRPREEALQLGWVPVFLLTVTSRYYWAGAALVVLVPGGRWLAVGLASAFASGHVARWARASEYVQYLVIEAALALVLIGWMAIPGGSGRYADPG